MTAGIAVFLLVIALMALGVPVAFAFLAANLVGAWLIMGGGWAGPLQLVDNSTQSDHQLYPGCGSHVRIHGRPAVSLGPGAARVRRAGNPVRGGFPARLSYITVAGGATLFHADRIDHGQHRHAGLINDSRDDPGAVMRRTCPSVRSSAPAAWPC